MKNNKQKVYPPIWRRAEEILKKGGIAVIPTDTIYGVLGSAFSRATVERIHKVKERDGGKPFIILISSYKDLEKFGVKVDDEKRKFLDEVWPGKVSVILPCINKKLKYLHRGTNSLAFRMIGPKNKNLFNLINNVGPLVAPSANPPDLKHANNIKEARMYFGDKIDLYLNVGNKIGKSSTIFSYLDDTPKIIRK